MEEPFVTLYVEGRLEDGGDVRLSDFIGQLSHLKGILNKLDRAASGGARSTEFRVIDIQRASPMRVVLGASRIEKRADVRDIVAASLFSTFERIGDAQALQVAEPTAEGEYSDAEFEILEEVLNMSAPVGERLRSVALGRNGHRVHLTPAMHERVVHLLQPQSSSYGFIRGVLESVNVHHEANTLRIYPLAGPKKVSCRFPKELRAQVGAALGEPVEVKGRLHYRADAVFPHEIDIESIVRLESTEDVSLTSLRGIARGLTGDLSSEDWLDRRRMEYEREAQALIGEL